MIWADEVTGAGKETERAVVRAFGMDTKKPIAGVGPLEGGSDADVVAVSEGVCIVGHGWWGRRGQVVGIREREAAARAGEAAGGGGTVGVQGRIFRDAVRGAVGAPGRICRVAVRRAGVIDRDGGGAVGTRGRIYRDAMGRAVDIYRDRSGDRNYWDR